jgi:hypothetical protein
VSDSKEPWVKDIEDKKTEYSKKRRYSIIIPTVIGIAISFFYYLSKNFDLFSLPSSFFLFLFTLGLGYFILNEFVVSNFQLPDTMKLSYNLYELSKQIKHGKDKSYSRKEKIELGKNLVKIKNISNDYIDVVEDTELIFKSHVNALKKLKSIVFRLNNHIINPEKFAIPSSFNTNILSLSEFIYNFGVPDIACNLINNLDKQLENIKIPPNRDLVVRHSWMNIIDKLMRTKKPIILIVVFIISNILLWALPKIIISYTLPPEAIIPSSIAITVAYYVKQK